MKKKFLVFGLVLFSLLISMSCSDDENNTAIELQGGTVYKAQVVTIQINNVDINQQEYIGYLDGFEVTLFKSGENQLNFMVPLDVNLGKQDLTIPSLREAVVHYTINETVLSQPVESELAPFFSNMEAFELTLDGSSEALAVQNSLNSFNSYYNSASEAEKEEFAIIYKANKSNIDAIFNEDYSHITGRSLFPNARTNVLRHKAYVAAMAIGCGIMITGNPILGGALAITGAYKAYKANADTVDTLFETISTEFNDVLGTADRSPNSILSNAVVLQDNQASQVSFNFVERKIVSGDINKTEPLAVTYFTSFGTYNHFANLCNVIINSTNNTFGTDFSPMLLKVLNPTNPSITIPVTQAMFNRMTFSVSHPNLQLVSKSLSSDGVLNVVVKIVGNPSSLPLQSNLKYSYSDDFTQFNGEVPISVSRIARLTGVSFANKTLVGVPCPGFNHSCKWEMRFSFDVNAPIGDYVKTRTIWDADGDGTFEGNLDGAFSSASITEFNTSGSTFNSEGQFCWGRTTTVTKLQYRYVTATGVEGPLMEAVVPR
jgi:hypothetical protein